MRSGIGDYVRRDGYRPSLRPELQFFCDGAQHVVVIDDPIRDRRYQLYENECLIAREMNGERDLDELTRVARRHVRGRRAPRSKGC